MMNTLLQGRWGETLAADYLKRKGYRMIGMGYRTRFGEIDLIAKYKTFIVFLEVKVRKNAKFAEAREFVRKSKQQRIKDTAQLWLAQNETALQPRFDVVEIYAPEGVNTVQPEIHHLEDAF
jgi:putative endonuclease